jgi:hypothetical protein
VEKEINLSRIKPAFAADLLAGCEWLDPSGRTGPDELKALTERGQCFAASATEGKAVYVLDVQNGVAQITACKGSGPVDWSAVLLPAIEAQAKGCQAVTFQTRRRGLVRKAEAQGYTVAGWILKKDLP